MDRRTFVKTLPAVTVLAGSVSGLTQEIQLVTLLKPETDSGTSVLAALWARRTNRNISDKPLPPQMLSTLLWAACGVNRESGSHGITHRKSTFMSFWPMVSICTMPCRTGWSRLLRATFAANLAPTDAATPLPMPQ